MRSLGGYKHEVSLSEDELDLVDASVLNQFFQVTLEVLDSIADARFVSDAMISGKVLRDLFVIPRDVNGLVNSRTIDLLFSAFSEGFDSVGPSV
jgi:hypothetical protein